MFSSVAALITAGNSAWSAARSSVGSCTAHWLSCAFATACRNPSEPTLWYASRNVAAASITGKYCCRNDRLPVSWYCCQMSSAISGPLAMLSAL